MWLKRTNSEKKLHNRKRLENEERHGLEMSRKQLMEEQ